MQIQMNYGTREEGGRGMKMVGVRNAHLKANYVYLNEIYIKVIICIVFNNAFKIKLFMFFHNIQHQLIMSTNISRKHIYTNKKHQGKK